MFLSRSRRETSDISFPHFFGKIFGCSPRQRDDGERRILIRIADERSGVGHEKILRLVRLAIFIEYRFSGIVAHPHCAKLMDNLTARGDALTSQEIGAWPRYGAAHGLQNGFESIVHVCRLLQFGVRPLEVETEHGYAVLIHDIGIDLAKCILIGDLLASARHADVGAVAVADRILQIFAIAFVPAAFSSEASHAGHTKSAADFELIPPL